MSFAGLKTFDRNLRTLIDSKAYKNADDGTRLKVVYRLLMSKYGVIGNTQPLEVQAKVDGNAEVKPS